MAYDGLLLDFDGIVVGVMGDATRLPQFRAAITDRVERAGRSLDPELIDRLAHGVTHETLTALSERTGIPAEELWRYRDDALATVLEEAGRSGEKTPYEDVAVLQSLSVPIGIASNNQQRVIESILATHGLAGQFDAIRAREPTPASLKAKKPQPTFLDAVIDELGVENPLFVGDKESDIIAGQRARVDTVLLRREHNATRPIDTEPTYEKNSLDAVAAILTQS